MIRMLKVDDYESYSALRSLGLTTEPTSFWASEDQELPIRKSRFIEIVHHPDNFISGYFHNELLVSIGGFIWGVYTHPNHRGLGFGKKLMHAIIDRAFTISDLNQINLSTRTDNGAAIGLYENLGFEIYGKEMNAAFVDGKFYHEIYMVKFKL